RRRSSLDPPTDIVLRHGCRDPSGAHLRFLLGGSTPAGRRDRSMLGDDMKAVILCGVLCVAAPSFPAAADPAPTFTRVCSACHTFGKGSLIGPDLKGVTNRRTRAWL